MTSKTVITMKPAYAVVMFAHNEAANLAQSVEAVHACSDPHLKQFVLLANGCTDSTVKVAHRLRTQLGFEAMHIVEITLADKCNAWNHYVHDLADLQLGCHFFVDADVRFSANAFPLLADALVSAGPEVNVIGGMPLSGRNVAFYQSLLRDRACFFGNLYGMHPRFLQSLRKQNFKLPTGLNWIDSFLTKAANTDLGFGTENLPRRVTYLEGVGFNFDSLKPWRWQDIKLYKNRIARYELGKLQEIFLDRLPADEWPSSMDDINTQIHAEFNSLTAEMNPIKRNLVKRRLARLLGVANHSKASSHRTQKVPANSASGD